METYAIISKILQNIDHLTSGLNEEETLEVLEELKIAIADRIEQCEQ